MRTNALRASQRAIDLFFGHGGVAGGGLHEDPRGVDHALHPTTWADVNELLSLRDYDVHGRLVSRMHAGLGAVIVLEMGFFFVLGIVHRCI
jgi:hypothetical protein